MESGRMIRPRVGTMLLTLNDSNIVDASCQLEENEMWHTNEAQWSTFSHGVVEPRTGVLYGSLEIYEFE
jgi:hypothetical protein